MQEYVLYGTLGCHLCEVAEAILVTEMDAEQHQVDAIDIAEDDELLERYGEKIPVLAHVRSGEELGWPFDAVMLRTFLDGCAAKR